MKKIIDKLTRPDSFVVLTTMLIFTLWITISCIVTFALTSPDWLIATVWFFTTICVTYMVYLVILTSFYLHKKVKTVAKRNRITKKFFENYEFRTIINTIFSVVLSIVYVVAQIVASIMTHSAWYGALAIYSVALMIMRIGIIYRHFSHTNTEDENDVKCIRSYRNCGFYLLGLDLILTVFIVIMITSNRGFDYPGLLIYAVAVHTFYKLIMSIIHINKAKQSDSFPAQTTRNLNFTSALVSILALQTALFHSFSKNFDATYFNAVTGVLVVAGIIVLAIIMIVNGYQALKKARSANPKEFQKPNKLLRKTYRNKVK